MPEITTTLSSEAIQQLINEAVEKQLNARIGVWQAEMQQLQQQLASLKKEAPKNKVTMLITSHELDKLLPAFIIGTGAASFGMEVCMYFTLWGINGLKQKDIYEGKSIMEKMLTFMLPSSPQNATISRMHMMGMGTFMMKEMMKTNHVETLPDMIDLAGELGVSMMACQMTMGIMGISREELRSDVSFGGVAAYIEQAAEARVNLTF
jgi:peroxiredoxin family protein